MEVFFVEGLFLNKQAARRAKKSGSHRPADVEPFARTIYARSAAEALQFANEALQGGEWLEPPRVSRTTEEQRMRKLGAPELPGFSAPAQKPKKPKA